MLKPPVSAQDHIEGELNALLSLVEYGDYQCPYCGSAYPIVKRIQMHFGKELQFVFRNFPLAEAHPFAEVAAETAEFAADHGRFWEMHDLLYENQARMSVELMFELVQALKLPPKEFEEALERKSFFEKVRKDFLSGVRSGVNGTPTFFINGIRHNGSFQFDALKVALEQAKQVKA